MPTELAQPEVQPSAEADAPNPGDEFTSYVARRNAEPTSAATESGEETVTEEVTTETKTSSAAEPEPKTAASETAKPAESSAATPTTENEPKPVPGSEPAKEHQEKKTEPEKDTGVPQWRLDEVTKARRAAERERDEANARLADLQKQVEGLKAKPPETAKPSEPQPEPELQRPDPEKYELGAMDPKFIEDLTDYKIESRKRAEEKVAKEAKAKADAAEEAKRRQDAENATKVAREKFEAHGKAQIEKVRAKYPDYDELIARDGNKPIFSTTLVQAIQEHEEYGELLHYFLTHQSEAERIRDITKADAQDAYEWTRAKRIANRELDKIAATFATTEAQPPKEEKPAEVKPAAEATPPPVAEPEKPKSPENPKPSVTRAPKPPASLTPSSTAPKKASEIEDFGEWEKIRAPLLARR